MSSNSPFIAFQLPASETSALPPVPHPNTKPPQKDDVDQENAIEKKLVQQAKAGNTDAFSTLIQNNKKRTLRLLIRLLHDFHTAEDVYQESSIKAFKSISNFRGKSTFSTWFTSIAINTGKTEIEKLTIRNHYSNTSVENDREEYGNEHTHSYSGISQTPDGVYDAEKMIIPIERALSEVSEKHKKIFEMRVLEGLSETETARQMGIPLNTVKSGYSYVRGMMQEIISEYGYDVTFIAEKTRKSASYQKKITRRCTDLCKGWLSPKL